MHINNAAQNHPELVVRDLEIFGVPPETTRWILWWRGVNKWLCARRLIIALKLQWLDRIREIDEILSRGQDGLGIRRYHRLAGEREALAKCRAQVRAICHLHRDVEWPTDPHRWPAEARLPGTMPARPNKRWLARFWGKTAA